MSEIPTMPNQTPDEWLDLLLLDAKLRWAMEIPPEMLMHPVEAEASLAVKNLMQDWPK